MKRTAAFFLLVFLFACVVCSDDLTTSLKKEFKSAGIALRLDRDETLRAELKIFDGFIKDSERAYACGIRTIEGGKFAEGTIVFFQIRPDGELRQIFQGHVVLKRRYKSQNPEDRPGWKTIISAEERISGSRLCAEQDKAAETIGK
jgi:hypothetical protein